MVTYPSGQKHWYKYDETGRNNSVLDPSQPLSNGSTITYPQRYSAVYDWAGRMTQMATSTFMPFGSGDSYWSQSWSYNALGQMSGYGLGKDGHGVGAPMTTGQCRLQGSWLQRRRMITA